MGTKQSKISCFRNLVMHTCVATGMVMGTGFASAQDGNLGGAVKDAVQNQLNQNNAGQVQTGQTAGERGVNQAVQGLIQGQNAGDAVRGGLNEAAQSAIESPQQTLQRDQQRIQSNQPNGQPLIQGQGNIQGNAFGQNWQTDAQGRLFIVDDYGQMHYQQPGVINQANQHRQQYQNDGRQNAVLGANFNAGPQGIAVTSVQSNSWASTAGMQQGDILLSIDGQQVQGMQGLHTHLGKVQPGQQTQFMVLRNGQRYLLTATSPHSTTTNQQSAAKPAINDGGMAKRLDQLQREVEQLRNELKDIKTQLNSNTSVNGRVDDSRIDVENENEARLDDEDMQDDN